jgi:hypothetical protein
MIGITISHYRITEKLGKGISGAGSIPGHATKLQLVFPTAAAGRSQRNRRRLRPETPLKKAKTQKGYVRLPRQVFGPGEIGARFI